MISAKGVTLKPSETQLKEFIKSENREILTSEKNQICDFIKLNETEYTKNKYNLKY